MLKQEMPAEGLNSEQEQSKAEIELAGKFWEDIAPTIKQKISVLIREEMPFVYADEEMKQMYEEDFLNREEQFVKKTINKVQEVSESGKKIALLLDIDGTIGAFRPDSQELDKPERTVLRPSIVSLLEFIQKNFIKNKVGFLTTRGRSALEKQLEDSWHLELISSFVDQEFILSTSKAEQIINEEFALSDSDASDMALFNSYKGKELKKYLEKQSCISKELLPDTESEFNSNNLQIDKYGARKLIILGKFHKQHPDLEIIAVDNCQFPVKYLKNGIYLTPDSQFSI